MDLIARNKAAVGAMLFSIWSADRAALVPVWNRSTARAMLSFLCRATRRNGGAQSISRPKRRPVIIRGVRGACLATRRGDEPVIHHAALAALQRRLLTVLLAVRCAVSRAIVLAAAVGCSRLLTNCTARASAAIAILS